MTNWLTLADHIPLSLHLTATLKSYCYSLVVYNIGIEGRNPTTLNITLVYNSDAEDINPVITTLGKGKQIRGCLTSIMSECEKR